MTKGGAAHEQSKIIRTRNLPKHDLHKWEQFKAYNKRDVEVEMDIQRKLFKFPVPDFIWDEYHLDQEINDRGIAVDIRLTENAVRFDELTKTELTQTIQEITQLENPNSVLQMKQWLVENGLKTDSLDKKAVSELLKTAPPKLASTFLFNKKDLLQINAVGQRNQINSILFLFHQGRLL